MVQIIPHNRLTFGEAECDAVANVVRSGHWARGARVQELQEELGRMAGVEYAICVGSGLGALRLALGALGVRADHSVLVPAYSCVALANAVLAWGARVFPLDVEQVTWNVDPDDFQHLHELSDVRAAIVVNTFGAPACLQAITSRGIPVIEDCAHAFGLSAEGHSLGGRAEVGVLSFYATKLIGGGEGGAVVTSSAEIARFVEAFQNYGDQSPDGQRLNDKMNDLEASLVLAQLRRLPEMISCRQTIADRYLQAFSTAGIEGVVRLPAQTNDRVWYRFAVEMLRTPAKKVVSDLAQLGVQAAIPVTDWRPPGSPSCPVADRAYKQLISLPAYPSLTHQEQQVVIESFLKLCEEYARG